MRTPLPVHPRLRHPLTGEPLVAVGFSRRGPIWPIMGGAPADGDGGGAGGQGGDGSQGGSGQGSGQGGSGDGGQQGNGQQNGGQQGDQGGSSNGQQQTGQGQQGQQGDGQQNGQPGQSVDDLPDWAQRIVRDARAEAGSARTAAKEQAATEAQQELAQKIGVALGLVKDDQQADPAELAKQAQEAQRTAQVELAVYRNASKHQGDPDALLDSRAFLADVHQLDPTADDFQTKVGDAIKAAVEKNTKLKVGQAPGSSSADHGSGSGTPPRRTNNTDQPVDLSSAVSGYYR